MIRCGLERLTTTGIVHNFVSFVVCCRNQKHKIFTNTMKFTLAVVSVLLPLGNAFQGPSVAVVGRTHRLVTTELEAQKQQQRKKKNASNFMGDFLTSITNNFEPIHGGGSLEKDLDEQWEAQQAILQDRRKHQLDKEHLKNKYKDPEAVTFDLKVGNTGGPKKTMKPATKKSPWNKFMP